MKNEDRIVELLSEMLIRQDRFETSLNKITSVLDKLGNVVIKLETSFDKMETSLNKLETNIDRLASSQEKLLGIQERQEKILINILEVISDDVPKFDELIEMEQLEGKKVVLRKSRK